MPSAPLFYQPLVLARVEATPVGKTNVYDAHQAYLKQAGEEYNKSDSVKGRMDGIFRGFEQLQSTMPGSKSLDLINLSFDNDQYVANRVETFLKLHADQFDGVSPDQAAEMGANLVQQATTELGENRGFRAVGDTLEVEPGMVKLLQKHWNGDDLDAKDAAAISILASRELQHAVTPLDADATSPDKQWIEDGTAWLLGLWPGAAGKVSSALGLKANATEVDRIADEWRANIDAVDPKAGTPYRSVSALLGAAGVSGTDEAARAAAYQVLQSTPLDGVPAGIAQAIVNHNSLPADQASYFAGRIVETTGSAGNIKGLLAEIELAKQPPPVDPPGGGDTPPGDDVPPGTPPKGEDPPGSDTPPPVDPPKDGDKVDPSKGKLDVSEFTTISAEQIEKLKAELEQAAGV